MAATCARQDAVQPVERRLGHCHAAIEVGGELLELADQTSQHAKGKPLPLRNETRISISTGKAKKHVCVDIDICNNVIHYAAASVCLKAVLTTECALYNTQLHPPGILLLSLSAGSTRSC